MRLPKTTTNSFKFMGPTLTILTATEEFFQEAVALVRMTSAAIHNQEISGPITVKLSEIQLVQGN
jgi:hypothetical protein